MITLAELKTYLGISWTDQDDLLQIFVDSANDWVKSYLGKNIKADDYVDIKNGDWQRYILLDNYPVNSITSFEYNGWTLDVADWVELDKSRYELDPDVGKIFLTFYKHRWFQNYRISYNAWYTSIPSDLKLATLKIASRYFNNINSDGIQREKVAGDSITFESENISNDVLAILNNYKDVY